MIHSVTSSTLPSEFFGLRPCIISKLVITWGSEEIRTEWWRDSQSIFIAYEKVENGESAVCWKSSIIKCKDVSQDGNETRLKLLISKGKIFHKVAFGCFWLFHFSLPVFRAITSPLTKPKKKKQGLWIVLNSIDPNQMISFSLISFGHVYKEEK